MMAFSETGQPLPDTELSGETPAPAGETLPAKIDVLSAEWQAMNNEEKIAVCQIPEDRLKEMSTEELAAAVLDYPLLLNLFADPFDHSCPGFWAVYDHFNGLRELAGREGATDALLNYQATDNESSARSDLLLKSDAVCLLIFCLSPFEPGSPVDPEFPKTVPEYIYYGSVYTDKPATEYTVDTPYVYPLTPDMEEWKTLDGNAEMIKACEVPQDLLEGMTTRALLETMLDYPLGIPLYAFDYYAMGFSRALDYCGPLQELCRRPDALYEIMRYPRNPDDILKQSCLSALELYQPLYYGRSPR
ncbi:MAG: hypothetical protein LBH95_04760 [Oscillospiraceae bacterium]|jgi:hypothetical protein|nr:hypothetical protein [Oscillospiraceae bacterium]